MQKLLATGKVKTIGVSNFQISHLERLLNDPSCKVIPAVNQIEVFAHLLSVYGRSVLTVELSTVASAQSIVSRSCSIMRNGRC